MVTNKKQLGIWLDFKEAFLVKLPAGEQRQPEIAHIKSEIDWSVPKGGVRSKTPWGPQGGVNEQTYLERRKHEEKAYFESIVSAIDPSTDELYIFGPAEAKTGLQQYIMAIKHYHPQIRAVQTADSMTQNQIAAQVRNFFSAQEV